MYDGRAEIVKPSTIVGAIERGVAHAFQEFTQVSMNSESGDVQFAVIGAKADAVKVGDVVKGGLYVNYNADHIAGLEMGLFMERLVCTNGAVREDCMSRYIRQERSIPLVDWISTHAISAYSEFEKEIELYKHLSNMELNGKMKQYLNSIFDRFGVKPRLRAQILEEIINTNASSVYDVMNIITAMGSHSDRAKVDPTWSRSMLGLASHLATSAHVCDSCGSTVS